MIHITNSTRSEIQIILHLNWIYDCGKTLDFHINRPKFCFYSYRKIRSGFVTIILPRFFFTLSNYILYNILNTLNIRITSYIVQGWSTIVFNSVLYIKFITWNTFIRTSKFYVPRKFPRVDHQRYLGAKF